jgi:hypothetical protein
VMSAKLNASDIKVLLIGGPNGPEPKHLIDALSIRLIPPYEDKIA